MEARAQHDHFGDKAPFTDITDEKGFDASPVTYAVFYYQSFIMTVMSCSPAQEKLQKSFPTFKLDLPSSAFGKSLTLRRLLQADFHLAL